MEVDSPSSMGSPKTEGIDLQIYPKFATVGNFGAKPRCVHQKLWVKDSDMAHCKRCGEEFSFVIRKHHCRVCGDIFCNSCSGKCLVLAHDQSRYDIRACDMCYLDYQLPVVKTYKERNLIHPFPLMRGTLTALKDDHFYFILSFLPLNVILSTMGACCRSLYFRIREDGMWRMLYAAAHLIHHQPTPPSPIEGEGRNSPAVIINSRERELSAKKTLPPHPMNQYHKYMRQLEVNRKRVCVFTVFELFKTNKTKQIKLINQRYRILSKRSQDILANVVKVGVVGAQGVGKSALVNSFLSGSPYPCGLPTVGARMRYVKYRAKPLENCSIRFDALSLGNSTLEIVDCAGDNRYNSLLPVYLSGVHVLIVCCDNVSEKGCAETHSTIDSLLPMCPSDLMILICYINKTNKPQCQLPVPSLTHSSGRVRAVSQCNPNTGLGVTDIFRLSLQMIFDRDVLTEGNSSSQFQDPNTRDVGPSTTPSPPPLFGDRKNVSNTMDVLLGIK